MRFRPVVAVAALVPASIAVDLFDRPTATFFVSAAAVVPLAAMLGEATEQLALRAGPRVGGLLNATFGNAAELILGVFLIARGEIEVVRASITGSVIGNLLLVLGAAFFFGGLRHRELRFSARAASTHVVSMALAVAGLMMASIYARGDKVTPFRIDVVSVGVAVVLLVLYVATLVFSLITHAELFVPTDTAAEAELPRWSSRRAMLTLAVVGALVGLESELLSGALEGAVHSLGVSRIWLGLILVPIVGNAAEHSTAVILALKNKADIALDIAVGSSAQVALVVTPLLVFAGLAFGHHLTLTFTSFELSAIAVAVAVVALIALDGHSNWLEGAQLLGVYVILAVSSYFLTRA